MNTTIFNRISWQIPVQHLSKRTHEVSGQEEIWACIRSCRTEAAATEPLHQSDFSRPSWYCLQTYPLLNSGIFVYVLTFPTHCAAFCSQKFIPTLFTQTAKCITFLWYNFLPFLFKMHYESYSINKNNVFHRVIFWMEQSLKGCFFIPAQGRVMEVPLKRILENRLILL